jgi:hypothetical protein
VLADALLKTIAIAEERSKALTIDRALTIDG